MAVAARRWAQGGRRRQCLRDASVDAGGAGIVVYRRWWRGGRGSGGGGWCGGDWRGGRGQRRRGGGQDRRRRRADGPGCRGGRPCGALIACGRMHSDAFVLRCHHHASSAIPGGGKQQRHTHEQTGRDDTSTHGPLTHEVYANKQTHYSLGHRSQ
eukprot:scaffold81952_cov61-Phaeocystis_antarctica.AAC.7